jgi:protein-disulfide isomerase
MDDPAIQRRIDTNLRLARSLGIQGTPALVIGDALIPGAVETGELERAIKTARAGR